MDTIKNGIPISIDNDGLKDTLLMCNFTTDYNKSKLERVLEQTLSVIETERPFVQVPIRPVDTPFGEAQDPMINHFYTNGVFKVQIKDSQILFNHVKQYVGWKQYKAFIRQCIESLFDFVKFNDVAVRYISEYVNFSILNVLDGEFHLNNLPKSTNNIFELRYKIENQKQETQGVAITKIYDTIKENDQTKSIIDITIRTIASSDDLETLFKKVDYCHHCEKDMYFRLLSESFIKSKNPKMKE